MRPIIFRGKRLDNGEWVYGSLLLIGNLAYIYVGDSCPSEVNFEYEFIAVDPATVGQYTGLKDKKKKGFTMGIYCCCQMGNPIVRMWSLSMVCTAGHSTILKPRLSIPMAHIPTSPSNTVVLCSEPESSSVTSMTPPIC